MAKSNRVKFSISIRKDIQTLLDERAFETSRSRSSVIELLCLDALKKKPKRES